MSKKKQFKWENLDDDLDVKDINAKNKQQDKSYDESKFKKPEAELSGLPYSSGSYSEELYKKAMQSSNKDFDMGKASKSEGLEALHKYRRNRISSTVVNILITLVIIAALVLLIFYIYNNQEKVFDKVVNIKDNAANIISPKETVDETSPSTSANSAEEDTETTFSEVEIKIDPSWVNRD